MKLDNTSHLKAGNSFVERAYLGSELVWEESYILNKISGCIVGYSTRKLKDTADKCMRVTHNTLSTEMDIGFVNRRKDSDSLLTFANGGSVSVNTFYNQSSSSYNAIQATLSKMPRIVNSGVVDESLLYTNSAQKSVSTVDTVDLGDEITISLVFKINSNTGTIQTLFTNGLTSVGTGIKLFVNAFGTNDGRLILEISNGTSTSSKASSLGRIVVGTWYNAVATVSRTNRRCEIFVNSISEGATTNILNTFDSNRAINIGKFQDNQLYPNAYINEMLVFNKILSSSEIGILYKDINKYMVV